MVNRKSQTTANSPLTGRPTWEGVLARVVFFNEENSFTVASLKVPGEKISLLLSEDRHLEAVVVAQRT